MTRGKMVYTTHFESHTIEFLAAAVYQRDMSFAGRRQPQERRVGTHAATIVKDESCSRVYAARCNCDALIVLRNIGVDRINCAVGGSRHARL